MLLPAGIAGEFGERRVGGDRHSRQIPRGFVRARAGRVLPSLRHLLGNLHVAGEQVAHDGFRARHHAHDAGMPIDVGEKIGLETGNLGLARLRHRDDGAPRCAHAREALHGQRGEAPARFRDHVLDHHGDDAAVHLVDDALLVEAATERLAHERPGQGNIAERLEREQPGAQPVVEIMAVIGDVVGDGGHLRFAIPF